jgi:hypothetical protein
MRIEELEAWILRIAEQAKAKQPNEDSRVELKREWPQDPANIALTVGATWYIPKSWGGRMFVSSWIQAFRSTRS